MTGRRTGSSRGRPWALLAVVSVLVAVVATLVLAESKGGRGPTGDDARIQHVEGEGPLSMMSGVGGSSLLAPGPGDWWGTFGQAVPCVEDVPRARITGVRFDARPKPLEVKALFVSKPPVGERNPDHVYGLMGTVLGHYPDYAEHGDIEGPPIVSDNQLHSYDLPVVVDVGCASLPMPDAGWMEMYTEVHVDREGTYIPRTFIDYEVDGKTYTLEHQWAAIMCGTAPEVVETGSCPQEDGSEKRDWDESRSWEK